MTAPRICHVVLVKEGEATTEVRVVPVHGHKDARRVVQHAFDLRWATYGAMFTIEPDPTELVKHLGRLAEMPGMVELCMAGGDHA